MIRIRHNGAERSADPAGLASLEDLVAQSCEETGRAGEVLVRCRVNGMALDVLRKGCLAVFVRDRWNEGRPFCWGLFMLRVIVRIASHRLLGC